MLAAQIPVPEALPDTFRAVDLCGVLLNGVLGGLIARRKNYDLVGFVVLAILTATAGGILRDVMIQAGPPFALTDPYYLYTACAGALIAWWVPFRSTPARRLLVVADAVVLGTWSATGASKALGNGLGVMPALLLGCLTAVGGSMIRDVSVGETPAVFGGNKLYAIPALCAAGTDVALVSAGLAEAWAMLASALVGAGTCLVAYWRSWRLPVSADVERRRARSSPMGMVPRRRAEVASSRASMSSRLERSREKRSLRARSARLIEPRRWWARARGARGRAGPQQRGR